MPESQKTILEAKGQLISDYQNELESRWILDLKSKFDIELNEEVLQNVVKVVSEINFAIQFPKVQKTESKKNVTSIASSRAELRGEKSDKIDVFTTRPDTIWY